MTPKRRYSPMQLKHLGSLARLTKNGGMSGFDAMGAQP